MDPFCPDDLDGHMFDKKFWHGDQFPDTEEWDYKNNAKLKKHVGPMSNGANLTFGKKGYEKISEAPIKKADQTQYNDKGTVKKIRPSKTFSGYARKGRGR